MSQGWEVNDCSIIGRKKKSRKAAKEMDGEYKDPHKKHTISRSDGHDRRRHAAAVG